MNYRTEIEKLRRGYKLKDLNFIRTELLKHKSDLEKKYKVRYIGVFGSFVRGEQKKTSDVDILVEFKQPIGFFKFLELEEYLTKSLGIKVDLVSKKALKPYIGKQILNEVVGI